MYVDSIDNKLILLVKFSQEFSLKFISHLIGQPIFEIYKALSLLSGFDSQITRQNVSFM